MMLKEYLRQEEPEVFEGEDVDLPEKALSLMYRLGHSGSVYQQRAA